MIGRLLRSALICEKAIYIVRTAIHLIETLGLRSGLKVYEMLVHYLSNS